MSLESISKLSDLTGFDRTTIRKRLESVVPVVDGSAKKYETKEVLEILYANKEPVELIDGMTPLD